MYVKVLHRSFTYKLFWGFEKAGRMGGASLCCGPQGHIHLKEMPMLSKVGSGCNNGSPTVSQVIAQAAKAHYQYLNPVVAGSVFRCWAGYGVLKAWLYSQLVWCHQKGLSLLAICLLKSSAKSALS
jgi:hypothetical protein